jgi:ABC-type sugar transport system permease subunit
MWSGYLFISPWLVGFLAFLVYPLAMSLYMSFQSINNVSELNMKFVGWDNYTRAFIKDTQFVPFFLHAVRTSLIEIPLILTFSLFIASMLNQNVKGKLFFRGAFFLPVLIGSGFVMQQLLGLQADPMQAAMAQLQSASGGGQIREVGGLDIPAALTVYLPPELADALSDVLKTLTVALWKTGIPILLFIAGLQGISESLYESAKCDGATPWEMFWKITFPLLTPILLLNAIFTLVDSFTDLRNVMMIYIKYTGFSKIELGYASALGWLYFLFVFLLVVLVIALTRKRIVYIGER